MTLPQFSFSFPVEDFSECLAVPVDARAVWLKLIFCGRVRETALSSDAFLNLWQPFLKMQCIAESSHSVLEASCWLIFHNLRQSRRWFLAGMSFETSSRSNENTNRCRGLGQSLEDPLLANSPAPVHRETLVIHCKNSGAKSRSKPLHFTALYEKSRYQLQHHMS